MCATGGLSTRVFLTSHNHTAGQAGSATHFQRAVKTGESHAEQVRRRVYGAGIRRVNAAAPARLGMGGEEAPFAVLGHEENSLKTAGLMVLAHFVVVPMPANRS